MNNLARLGFAAILSVAAAAPELAQATIRQPGAFVIPDRGTAGAMAPVRLVQLAATGNETATRPWSAPVGHRQPRAADIPASVSTSRQLIDPEDVGIDRKIRGICRGC